MKSRHWVTIVVFLLGGLLLTGVVLRLQEAGGEEADGASDPAADSVREAVRSTAAQAAFATEVAVRVEGARVVRDTFVLWVRASGRASPVRHANLVTEVGGAILSVPVREGQPVAAGALLARIDPAPYELAVRRAEAEVERARADFQNLTLFDEEIEDPELQREREQQARIRSGLTGAEAALEEARYELAKTEVRAPFAGRVANLAVVEGSRVRPGDSLVAVVDLSRVDVDADVLETQLAYIEPGREARVTFPALPGRTFRGTVSTVNPLVERETRTARVTVRLSNPGARIVSGMHGNLEIAGRLLTDRTYVPKAAVVERDRREVVFLFEPDEPDGEAGRAKWTYVTTGVENDRFVEVVASQETASLEPGQVVLVDGHVTLTHDARVRLENAASLGSGVLAGERDR